MFSCLSDSSMWPSRLPILGLWFTLDLGQLTKHGHKVKVRPVPVQGRLPGTGSLLVEGTTESAQHAPLSCPCPGTNA